MRHTSAVTRSSPETNTTRIGMRLRHAIELQQYFIQSSISLSGLPKDVVGVLPSYVKVLSSCRVMGELDSNQVEVRHGSDLKNEEQRKLGYERVDIPTAWMV